MKYTVLNCKVNFCSNFFAAIFESSFMIFDIGVYVFAISVLKSGEYILYETHPIGPELSGDGNGILVKTFCKYKLSQWVMIF